MQITEALINRFLSGEPCTPEEVGLVSKYLTENPDRLRDYLEKDWKAADEGASLSSEQSSGMLQQISERAFEQSGRSAGGKYRYGWAAAAAVVLIVAGVALLRMSGPSVPNRLAEKTKGVVTSATIAVREDNWKSEYNGGPAREKISLPDGSVVILYPGSSIRFRDAFLTDTRKVLLQGQAIFEVVSAKSTSGHGNAPFLVLAGKVATTVLGTTFHISENEQGVTVRLLKGKVRVHAAERDFVLTPGLQVIYRSAGERAEISAFSIDGSKEDNSGKAERKRAEALVFDNTPLPEVMEKLMMQYQVPIQYDKQAIGKMYFTGSVYIQDSLSTILQVIARMNDLKVVREESSFVVSASPK